MAFQKDKVAQLLAPSIDASGTTSGFISGFDATGKLSIILNAGQAVGAGAFDCTVYSASGSGATETAVATFTRHSSGTPSGIQIKAVDARDLGAYLIGRAVISGTCTCPLGMSVVYSSAIS
jgi:hypothetical protein